MILAHFNIPSPSDLQSTLEFSPIFDITLSALLLFQSLMHILKLKYLGQIFKTNIFL